MKYIIISLLIILLFVLVYQNKETFTSSIIKKNLKEIKDKLPGDPRYQQLITDITDELKTDLNKGLFLAENIDQSNVSGISKQIVTDTEIQKNVKDIFKNDDDFKQISKGNQGDRGESGISTENDVLKADSLYFGDQFIDETKLKQMINFSERNNLLGNKLIINSNINEQKAQELALDDGTTLIPKLNLGGNIMSKDGEFIKIENGFINKLKIGNQEISSQSDKLIMNNVDVSNVNVNNLLVKDNNLNPGPIGAKGDTGPQGWGIESGNIVGNKVKFTTKGGNTFEVNFDSENPIDNLYGPRGEIGNKGLKGDKGALGISASEGELSEDGTLTLSYNLPDGSKKSFVLTGDKIKGEIGNKGPKGNTGANGQKGTDITGITVTKNTATNNLKLNINGEQVNGEYSVTKGEKGNDGTNGIDGNNFELAGIENTTDGLLFKKNITTDKKVCFDDEQNFCINNDTNKKFLLNNLRELAYNISKFFNLDQNKNLSEIIQDIFVYYEYMFSGNPLNWDVNSYKKAPYNFNSDAELNLVRMLKIKQYLPWENGARFNKIKLCKLAGIDVLNLYKVIKYDTSTTIPPIKVFQKINEIIEYIGTKLNITSGSQNEKIEKILEKQPDDIKEAYLRYMFEFLGFDNTPDNEDFFNGVKDKVKEIFGADIENGINGIKESDIKVDTIQNKEKLLNILLNFFTYKDDNNNTKVYKV